MNFEKLDYVPEFIVCFIDKDNYEQTVNRKQQKELESLTNQVSLDPMCTIQLRESTQSKNCECLVLTLKANQIV
jgi:hypothetical protein